MNDTHANARPATVADTTCIVLAGGLGTRLRDTIGPVPKCMAPVCGRPFLDYLLRRLHRNRFRKIVLSLGYLHEQVETWVEREKPDFDFDFSVERQPLGTGGAIALAMTRVRTPQALILNGDTFFDMNTDAFLASHASAGTPMSIALKPMRDFDRYGNVRLDADGRVEAFEEKRHCAEGTISAGCYLLRRDSGVLDGLPERFSFETDVLQPLAGRGLVHGYTDNGYFIDIGVPEDYERANRELCRLF